MESSENISRSRGGEHPQRSAAARWGKKPELFDHGFLVVPNSFFERYAALGLSTAEALFVLHLMSFKWEDAAPYPTYATLANRMGISDKMVRRYAQSLSKKGYLRRMFQRRAANRFDLTALFGALSRATALNPQSVTTGN
jgi:DNA-binding MarR family transcriptional regulator